MAKGTPLMTAKDLLKYYGTLLSDRTTAIAAGNTDLANELSVDIENARVMLRTSFYATAEESVKEQKVDMRMFNRSALQLTMGDSVVPTGSSAPEQMALNLQEEATDTTFEEVAQVEPTKVGYDETLKSQLEKILSGQFTSYVPNAVHFYNHQTGQNLSLGKAWKEILDIVDPSKGHAAWHDFIIDTVYNKTPLHAMLYLGRLWKNVREYQIADFVEEICLNCATSEFDAIRTASKFDVNLHHDLVHGYRKYPELRKMASNICNSEADIVIDGCISRYVAAVPHQNRERMRKKYVEKGYK